MWPTFLRAEQVGPLARLLQRVLAVAGLVGLHLPSHHVTDPDGAEYDFIVVGAGTAGCVVASRLAAAAAPAQRVLLVEAGGDPPLQAVIPGLFSIIPGSKYDWNYEADTSQNVCRGQKEKLKMVRGKMLGGCSCLNLMFHVLGHPADYDGWAAVAGADGWAYHNISKFIKNIERVHDADILNSQYGYLRGQSGNINITRQIHREQTLNYFKAFYEMGYRISHDYNTGPPSFSEGQFTVGGGRRSSSAAAYLAPAHARPNLRVLTHTTVTRLIFEGNRAVAVQALTRDGKAITIKAKKEIILSAGAINTPLLLMQSGIGPRDHLQEFNIEVLADLPVGLNLQDHPMIPIVLTGGNATKPDPTTLHEFPLPAIVGFVSMNDSDPRPDYQVLAFPAARGSKNPLLQYHGYGLKDEICNRVDDAAALQETFLAHIVLLHPASRGRVRLRGANSTTPSIYMGYYDVEEDFERHISYVENFLRILNTTHFKNVQSKVVDVKLPSCSGLEFGRREYWRCYAREMVTTMWHPVGTAAMGARAVLDARLRVRGVRRLRVADAAAMPRIPSGNTNAPAALLAEYAAQLIKEEHF